MRSAGVIFAALRLRMGLPAVSSEWMGLPRGRSRRDLSMRDRSPTARTVIHRGARKMLRQPVDVGLGHGIESIRLESEMIIGQLVRRQKGNFRGDVGDRFEPVDPLRDHGLPDRGQFLEGDGPGGWRGRSSP